MSDPRRPQLPRTPAGDLPVRLVDGPATTVGDLAGSGPLVLFFFPAAFSPGCVAEACAFRNLTAEFAARGATCVGVSTDSPRRLRAFARTFRLGLPLASDRQAQLASRFDATRRFPARFLRRVTVVVDGTGTVHHRIEGLRDLDGHAAAALAFLDGAAEPTDPAA